MDTLDLVVSVLSVVGMHDLGGVLVQSIEETELRDVCPRDEHVTLFLLVLGFGSRGRRERCSGEWGGHDVSFCVVSISTEG